MAGPPIQLAIFDFDGTLTTGHLWLGIARHHRTHKIKRLAVYIYLITHLPFWLASKIRIYGEEKNRGKWGADLAILFEGFSPQKAKEAFSWVTTNYFLPLMRADIVAKLEEHKKQGYKIVILSGMFHEFLEIVAEELGADYVVGTRMELKHNIYTGRIIPPLCFGENKARLLNEFIRQRNLHIDFKRSFAYADSYYDLPVFKLVGNPVAVYPDKELAEIARANKWPIIRE
jgi:HAD superfamily hydrolase (TIGR01490 family)